VDGCRLVNREGPKALETLDERGLPTLRNTVLTTAILEAGRRAIDEGREVGIKETEGGWELV
jgi:D-galacturonate reductase